MFVDQQARSKISTLMNVISVASSLLLLLLGFFTNYIDCLIELSQPDHP